MMLKVMNCRAVPYSKAVLRLVRERASRYDSKIEDCRGQDVAKQDGKPTIGQEGR
jgi:hypothetical protein